MGNVHCVGLLLRSFVVSTLVLDYSVSACFALDYSFVRSSWMIFVDSFLSFDSRQFSVCTCESASTVAIVVESPLCVDVSFRLRAVVVSTSAFGSRRRLLAVTFDVRCILSTVGVGHSEESFPLAGLA